VGRSRLDQHAEQIVGPKAHLAAGQTNDARITAPKHLNFRSPAQAELRKLVNLIGMAKDARDTGTLADEKLFQRDSLTGWLFFHSQKRQR
jgi:hypothetical protein